MNVQRNLATSVGDRNSDSTADFKSKSESNPKSTRKKGQRKGKGKGKEKEKGCDEAKGYALFLLTHIHMFGVHAFMAHLDSHH